MHGTCGLASGSGMIFCRTLPPRKSDLRGLCAAMALFLHLRGPFPDNRDH